MQARAHTKTHHLDIWVCRSERRILTRPGAVRTHGGRCQQRRRAERSLPKCRACLVCITLTDHWRSAQSRARTPQSGSVMLEPSLWGGKVAAEESADVTGPHGSSHPATVAPSVCSCFGSRCGEFHWDSTNPQGSSHPNTTRAGCYDTTTSAPSSTASVKRLCLSSSSSSLCLIHSFIALFLSFSDAHPYFHFTALSLILSCVSVLCSACAQRMSNMCWGWGLGTADFIGGTLTSHTDRFAEDGTVCAHILCTAADDFDKIRLASFSCQRS